MIELNFILDDIINIGCNIKIIFQRIIFNKFCIDCGQWLWKKNFIFSDSNQDILFCDENCKKRHLEMFNVFKEYYNSYKKVMNDKMDNL
jgi:hypothetical protein